MTSAAPALSLRLTQAGYGAGAPVLGALDLSVAPGETLGIMGPSGVGKTTLMRILAGLHRRFAGSRHVAGRLAMVFQDPMLLPWRRSDQNLTLTTGCSEPEARAALADVGLAGLEARYPGALSLGQQRRLALARAFAGRPAVLLLDEPFVSLDAATHAEMLELFRRLRAEAGVATVLVTHSEAEAGALCDRVLWLDGRPARLTARAQAA